MSFRSLQLVCIILILSCTSMVRSQSTATINGVIAATGQPSVTVSYLIAGSNSSGAQSPPSSTSTNTDSSLSATGLPAGERDQGLSIGAVIGVVVTIAILTAAAITGVIYIYKHQSLARGQAKRKSIMDLEFGVSGPVVQHTRQRPAHIVDLAKPLPVVTADDDMDRLSRSSTIIADAGEVAKISRKASIYQSQQRICRDVVRERNHALHALIGNENRVPNETILAGSALIGKNADGETRTGDQSMEEDAHCLSVPLREKCSDGDGDAFAHRPSKL